MLDLALEGACSSALPKHIDEPYPATYHWRNAASLQLSGTKVKVATSASDLLLIGKLRYEYFIARDGKPYTHADHTARSLIEPVDRRSLNFYVEIDNKLVAAVRLSRSEDAVLDEQLSAAIAHSSLDKERLHSTVLNSRLVVREETRARLCVPELFRMVYRAGRLAGAQHCVAAARPSVIPLFQRFGFVVQPGSYACNVAGTMRVAVLDSLDHGRLVETRSPFLAEYEALAVQQKGYAKL